MTNCRNWNNERIADALDLLQTCAGASLVLELLEVRPGGFGGPELPHWDCNVPVNRQITDPQTGTIGEIFVDGSLSIRLADGTCQVWESILGFAINAGRSARMDGKRLTDFERAIAHAALNRAPERMFFEGIETLQKTQPESQRCRMFEGDGDDPQERRMHAPVEAAGTASSFPGHTESGPDPADREDAGEFVGPGDAPYVPSPERIAAECELILAERGLGWTDPGDR